MSTWLSFFINLHHYTGITVRSWLSSTIFLKMFFYVQKGMLSLIGAVIYGQISIISVLPVTGDWILRADPRNRRFARNG